MKLIISFILLVVNFMIFQQTSLMNPSQKSFHPPVPLKDVIEEIPEGYGIVRITVVDEDHRNTDVVFKKPHTNIDEFLKEYKRISDKNRKRLLQLFQVRSGHESEQYLKAKEQEIAKIKELMNSEPTEYVLVKRVIYEKL